MFSMLRVVLCSTSVLDFIQYGALLGGSHTYVRLHHMAYTEPTLFLEEARKKLLACSISPCKRM